MSVQPRETPACNKPRSDYIAAEKLARREGVE